MKVIPSKVKKFRVPLPQYHSGVKFDNQAHRIVRNQELVEKITHLQEIPLNKEFVKNCLIIGLKKSFKERMEVVLRANPFKGTTEVIEAIDGSLLPPVPEGVPLRQGDLGCLLSHKKALEYARDRGYSNVLILEDDIKFVDGFNEKLDAALRELPEIWDMLYIGGTDAAKQPSFEYSKNLKLLMGSWGTYGYIIREHLYDYFIDLFSEQKRSSDDYFRSQHSRFRCFRTRQNLVIHTGGEKGISDRVRTNISAANG